LRGGAPRSTAPEGALTEREAVASQMEKLNISALYNVVIQ